MAESESSGAPIDLLYELVKQKGLPDTPLGLPPSLTKKSNSPKEIVAGAPRPGLLALAKPLDVPAVNKAIKSPPGFSAKGLAHAPNSPLLKKASLALAGSPTHKNPEDKSPQLSLSPRPASPKAQWPQSEDEGPLNLSECGSWEPREGRGLRLGCGARVDAVGTLAPARPGSAGSERVNQGAVSPVGRVTCLPFHFAVLPPGSLAVATKLTGVILPLRAAFDLVWA